ncbi:MAG TPA: hypothetical protein VM866_10675 [Pyrinomonadaceae bacterium]|nr:hypothetical protein [Pyrinomonadaceae bacterium]
MSCKIFQIEIKNRDWGTPLSLATREHLDCCEECRKIHDEQTSLRLLIGELEKVCAPADFEFRLRSRIAATENAGRTTFRERLKFSPNTVSLVLAGAFVLTSALTIRFARFEQSGLSNPSVPIVETATKTPAPIQTVIPEEARTLPDVQPVAEEIVEQIAHHKYVNEQKRKSTAGQPRIARRAFPLPAVEATSGSNTMGLTKAPVISAQMATVAIPMSGGIKSVSLILRNERGESQKVSIKSVSFGTQEFAGRFNNLARSSSTVREGVW